MRKKIITILLALGLVFTLSPGLVTASGSHHGVYCSSSTHGLRSSGYTGGYYYYEYTVKDQPVWYKYRKVMYVYRTSAPWAQAPYYHHKHYSSWCYIA